MKVLILALPRTGTSTLLYRIADQGFEKISEPYNRPLHKNKYPWPLRWDSYKTDIAVKHLLFSDNSNIQQLPLPKYTKDKEFSITLFAKEFDKIILLDRRDYKIHLESYINLHYKMDYDKKSVHLKYKYEEIPSEYINNFLQKKKQVDLIESKQLLKELSTILNIPITWYEDLYGEDRLKSLEIIQEWAIPNIDSNLLNERLDPQFRYRQFGDPTKLF